MLKIYFGDWGTGKLQRLQYLGYYVLLIVLIMAIIMGGIMAVGAAESMMNGSIANTQAMLLNTFGIAGVIGIVILIFAMIVAQVNIAAKRIRDIGLPVLWTFVGIIALSMVLNIIFPPQEVAVAAAVINDANTSAAVATTSMQTSAVVQIFDTVIFLCLLLIPSNTFKNKTHY